MSFDIYKLIKEEYAKDKKNYFENVLKIITEKNKDKEDK